MDKKRFMPLLAAIAMIIAVMVGGCSATSGSLQSETAVIIDWVDFVKLDGKTYTGLHGHVIKDPGLVTDEVVGEVKFKVADVVKDAGYRTKNGDAAYLAVGTKLYRVEGFKPGEIIAAEDKEKIGGYRLYAEADFRKSIEHLYADMPKDRVERIELYAYGEARPFRTLTGEEAARFIDLLDNGEDKPDFVPDLTNGDPDYYTMVFCTDGPLAYAYTLEDDGKHVYFHPDFTRVVDGEIRQFLGQR